MLQDLRIACVMLVVMTLLTGLVYPLAVAGVSQLVFNHRAEGSLITENGKAVGSELVGQPFDDPKYFWSRPSATGPVPYNGASSSGSNLAVSNPAQAEAIAARIKKLRDSGVSADSPIPIDLVTASGSGLDPHISPAAAEVQVSRVAQARGMNEAEVRRLVAGHTEGRQFGCLGEARVNVLLLNLALVNANGKSQTVAEVER